MTVKGPLAGRSKSTDLRKNFLLPVFSFLAQCVILQRRGPAQEKYREYVREEICQGPRIQPVGSGPPSEVALLDDQPIADERQPRAKVKTCP